MSIRRKNFIGFIIGTFFVAGISGGFIGYIFPRTIEEGKFNVNIDGNFNAGEGWQYSDWQFKEYLLVDDEDLTTHNYFYIHLTATSLYILIDFASDITNDTTGEFLSVWIDTDNSLTEYYNDEFWNSQITNPGQELLCFIPETGSFNDTLYITDLVFPINDLTYSTTLNESNSVVEFGFQSSINSPHLHRIFEIEIDRAALRGFNTSNFNIGFLGYGTVYVPIYTELGIWGAPTIFVSDFYDRSRWIREQTFFKCGYGVEM